jgi:starch-binding outer membrane protein, SusD/RagB family
MKIYKLFYKTLICVAVAGGFSSCVNSWLDESPNDSTNASSAISSSADLNTARIGMYAILRGNSTLDDYYAARMIYYGDVRGEDMQAVTGGGGRTTVSYKMTWTTPTDAPYIWQTPYIVIERANNIITAAESGTLSDESTAKTDIAQYEAEAKVARAMAHFDLVRVYGKPYTMDSTSFGVPVVSSVLEPTVQEGRNTVAEVYKQVISDLTSAINSGALQTTKDDGYINVWAAKALLTRVYLTKGDNQAALNVAEDIIAHSPYTLWTNAQYVDAWDKSNSAHTNEALFEFVITSSSYWTDREGIAYLYAESGYNDAVATKSFIDKVKTDDPNDVRLGTILLPKNSTNIKAFTDTVTKVTYPAYINKYRNDGGDVRYSDVMILRLSEVYLSAAEAAYKLGDKTTAAKYLDAIVNRADTAKHATASTITLTQILWERRKELIGEGQRFFDAMRNNETIVRYTRTADQGWNAPLKSYAMSYDRTYYKALLPIPQSEIDANAVIAKQQNTGY